MNQINHSVGFWMCCMADWYEMNLAILFSANELQQLNVYHC